MHFRIWVCLSGLVGLSNAFCGQAVEPPAAHSVYEYREGSRDGIGKFHCGREIARVMGHEAAD